MADPIIVVAHPDDEVLWFGSVLPRAERVMSAFQALAEEPELGERRARALRALPYSHESLRLVEAGSFGQADWQSPRLSRQGLDFAGARAARYRTNFDTLREKLKQRLPRGATVYTHNPWGEYGHEDHVQIFHAVASLCAPLSLDLKVPCYYSERSRELAATYRLTVGSLPPPQTIDADFCERIGAIYRAHGCWTWRHPWRWPSVESFLPARDWVPPAQGAGACVLDTAPVIRVPNVGESH